MRLKHELWLDDTGEPFDFQYQKGAIKTKGGGLPARKLEGQAPFNTKKVRLKRDGYGGWWNQPFAPFNTKKVRLKLKGRGRLQL